MKMIILDGSREDDRSVEHILLRDKKIGNCAGDFFCWVRSPGACNVDDDNREIANCIANSDLVVYLTPVTFGGGITIV